MKYTLTFLKRAKGLNIVWHARNEYIYVYEKKYDKQTLQNKIERLTKIKPIFCSVQDRNVIE